MRMPVILLPNSMPLTVQTCFVIACALLLFCLTSCLGSHYEDCLHNSNICGGIEVGYPFGINGSGCGDPEFQLLPCDSDNHPLINISGSEYHIMESSFLANSSTLNILRIVNDNLWGGNCNFSGNYSPFWRSDSLFQINDTYTNLTLWKHCDQISQNLSLCGDNWYYSLNPELNLEGATSCQAFYLPINKSISPQFINSSLLGWGFEVTWRVDPNRSRSCEACLKSNGSCGYNISEPTSRFLCYCPDGTSHPDKCVGKGAEDAGGQNMSEIIIAQFRSQEQRSRNKYNIWCRCRGAK